MERTSLVVGLHFVWNRISLRSTLMYGRFPNLPVAPLATSPVQPDKRFFGSTLGIGKTITNPNARSGAVRSHDLAGGKARWQYIQPSDNTWDWVDLDAWVNAHYAAGRDILFTLFGTPSWASARPTERNAYSDQDPEVISVQSRNYCRAFGYD